ncbi:MAG: hypothetical protein K1X57_22840 [Gemmataceae bacterium]|nr:hypothetical protein [Gemmataceae bacterium]
MTPAFLRIIVVAGLSLGVLGCSTTQTSNTARTATEQLLLSNAVDQSLDKIDFRPLAGQNVFLEEKYMDSVDKQYVLASIRHRILRTGGRLVDKADAADIVLEPRSGGVGTSSSSSFVGIPSIVLPGMLTLPEVKFYTRSRQAGFAKIGIAAYDPKTHENRGNGGMTVAVSDDNNSYLVGIGPFQSGTLREEIARTTTGPAATRRDQLPANIVFNTAPRRLPDEAGAALINSEVEQTRGTAPSAP